MLDVETASYVLNQLKKYLVNGHSAEDRNARENGITFKEKKKKKAIKIGKQNPRSE